MRNFTLSPTGQRGLDDFVSMAMRETGEIKPYTLDSNKEWRIEARIGVTFWANDAQVRDAREIALRALYAGIYREILQELPRLRLAISDGKRSLAFDLCDTMELIMTMPYMKVQP